MNSLLTRFRVSLSVVVVAQALSLGSAFAVPSDRQAWSSQKYGITVFHDDLDPGIFWFVPAIRFETSAGKTMLRPKTLPNGKIGYTTRIIPYFSDDMRALVYANIPEIRNDSQLKPVVAKNIGVALPDFDFKMTTEGVTNYGYLDVPRVVDFQLDPDQAERFDTFVSDPFGVTLAFTISYDGVVRDKYYQISVSCSDLYQAMNHSVGAGANVDVAKKAHVGASIEAAFKKAVQNDNGGVDIISKGELPGMEDTLRQTVEFCFQPDGGGRHSDYYRDEDDLCRGGDDCLEPRSDGDLMPRVALKTKYRFKKENLVGNREATVKHVNVADAVSTTVVMTKLRLDAPVDMRIESKVVVDKTFTIRANHTAVAPLSTGISVKAGDQFTVHAEYVLKIGGRSIVIDPKVKRADGDLYYRIGTRNWVAVNRHTTIASDITRGGGELRFYLDYSTLLGKLTPQLRFMGAVPEFTVQVTGLRLGSN